MKDANRNKKLISNENIKRFLTFLSFTQAAKEDGLILNDKK